MLSLRDLLRGSGTVKKKQLRAPSRAGVTQAELSKWAAEAEHDSKVTYAIRQSTILQQQLSLAAPDPPV